MSEESNGLKKERSSGGLPNDPPKYEDVESAESSASLTPIVSPNFTSLQHPNLTLHNKAVSSSKSKNRNQPYMPAKHLQSHIDRLGGLSLNLATYSTDTRTEYFDILPSFQMYQSILKRNDFEFNESTLGSPPVYDAVTPDLANASTVTQDPAVSRAPSLLESTSRNLQSLGINENDDDHIDEFEGQYLFSEIDSEEGLQGRSRLQEIFHRNRGESQARSRRRTPLFSGGLTHESYGDSVLDNIDMLPHAKSSPLSIEIYVTKDVPVPNEHCELETKLKEYSSGDAVHGYMVITNNLEKRVDFGLFTVSLECTVKAVYATMKGHMLKPNTILQKKLLKMYDLNASYNEGPIPSSAGIEYNYLSRDEFDGCIIGLPNDRILEPKERYKKFVMFKFPEMLLDNTCPHGVLRHTMPPPSFGLDCTAFHRRASTIEINKALGYGFLNSRGSPIKVKDYSFDDVSVSYAIEAKFIDKLHTKDQRVPISTNDINDPESELQYIVSKSGQFFLRFIPNVISQVRTYSNTYRLFGYDTFESIGIDGVLYSTLAKRDTWRFIERMNLIIKQEIQSALDKKEFSHEELKQKHLFPSRTEPGRDDERHQQEKNSPFEFFGEHSKREMKARNIVFSNETVDIFAKKKRLLLSATKIGKLMLCVHVPDKILPYGSPRLIQKYNNGKKESVSKLTTSREELLALVPMNSNMLELYNRNEGSVISEIKIELYFKTSADTLKPPSISLIEFEVVAWSYRTDYPIPFSFEHDFFYTKPQCSGAVIQHDDVEITKQNLLQLKETVNDYITFLRDSKTHISQNTYSYLKGLSKMGFKKDTIREYIQSVQASPQFGEDGWTGEKLDYTTVLWSKSLTVPVKILNKNSITLPPSFQSCLVGRLYAIQILVKFKGGDDSQNLAKLLVPVLVG